MIRHARITDMPRLMEMGREFYPKSGNLAKHVPMDEASVHDMFMRMMGGDKSILLVSESGGEIYGMIAAVVFPSYMNNGIKICQELFWWVDPDKRNGKESLLDDLEEEAKAMGVNVIVVSSLDSIRPDVMRRFFVRKGFQISEHTFVKGLI